MEAQRARRRREGEPGPGLGAVVVLALVACALLVSAPGGVRTYALEGSGTGEAHAALEPSRAQVLEGMQCLWAPDEMDGPGGAPAVGGAARQEGPRDSGRLAGDGDVAPTRTVRDPYPAFTSVAVDLLHDEVVLTDDNRFNLLIYDRRVATEGVAEPRRRIGGEQTRMEFISGVAVDPQRREIYTVSNDVMDNMLVFAADQGGDVAPVRELQVDHGAWAVSLDTQHDELAISIQHTNKIVVYPRTAEGRDAPVRIIQGPQTGITDPHGVFIDSKNDEIVVANQTSWHEVPFGRRRRAFDREVEGEFSFRPLPRSTGRFVDPSITVYARTAHGDVAPLRQLRGPKTRLNLPLGVYVDTDRDEIYVANDGDDSVLVFERTASGDVAPARVLAGPATGLKNPAGVFVDAKNGEIWVSNWGNHSATVYGRTASGNAAPLRVVRSAPADAPLPGIGNPGAVAYDSKRDEILVPN